MAGDRGRIGKRAIEAIEADGARVVISAVSVWEVAIKRRLGKLDAPGDLLAQLEGAGVELLPITASHADRVSDLSDHHRDPFDRLLVAQALVEGMALATADASLRPYGIELVW